MDRAYLSHVESGKKDIGIMCLEKVAHALGVSVGRLLE